MKQLAHMRLARGLTLRTLADWSGLPERVLGDIESGRLPVCWLTAKRIARHLGRTPLGLLADRLRAASAADDVFETLVEIALAAGEPEHVSESDRRFLVSIEPVYGHIKWADGTPVTMEDMRASRRLPEDGFMPLPGRPVQSESADYGPTMDGFMPIRRVFEA